MDLLQLALYAVYYFQMGGVLVALGCMYHVVVGKMTFPEAFAHEERLVGLSPTESYNPLVLMWRVFLVIVRWPFLFFPRG